MNVKELINKLSKMNPELNVHVQSEEIFDDGDGYIDTLETDIELKDVEDHEIWVLLTVK